MKGGKPFAALRGVTPSLFCKGATMYKEHALNIEGHKVVLAVTTRRYPDTTFFWGYWRFEQEPLSAFRSLGDPWSGKGSISQIKQETTRLVKQYLEKNFFQLQISDIRFRFLTSDDRDAFLLERLKKGTLLHSTPIVLVDVLNGEITKDFRVELWEYLFCFRNEWLSEEMSHKEDMFG